MKKIFLSILLIFILFSSFSQEFQSKFSVIGVKSENAGEDLLKITVFFNDEIDFSSVSEKEILVNDKNIRNTKILFSKRGRNFSFFIKKTEEKFSLRFENIKNTKNQMISSIRLDDFEENVFWKFSKEKHQWQKF